MLMNGGPNIRGCRFLLFDAEEKPDRQQGEDQIGRPGGNERWQCAGITEGNNG